MNSIKLLNLKNNTKYQILSETIIKNINELFSQSNIKFKNKKYKKTSNILKNNNFQLNKNKIENKTILILNKVSNDNIDNLVTEFLQNINITNNDEYNLIQTIFYKKLVKEINMIDNYFLFFMKIFSIIHYNLMLTPTYFINLIENKILFDYKDIDLDESIDFLKNYSDELYRVNNLKILKYFIYKQFLSVKVKNDINKILLEQNKYIPDIAFWFNKDELEEIKDIIINKVNLCNSIRDKILLENLLENYTEEIKIDIKMDPIKDDSDEFSNLVENIMEEYFYLESNEEIKEFIINECINAEQKNIFCAVSIKYYFTNENNELIIKLFNYLIKNKIIFKSNLSRGLILYISNNEISNLSKIKKLLLFLKNNNITKNIEHIFKKYKMKTYYEY